MTELHIRDSRNGEWFFVDNALVKEYGREIGAFGVAVYSVLAMYANGQTQDAYPSYQTIAHNLKCSRRQVIKVMDNLEELNIIKRRKRFIEGSEEHNSNLVTLLHRDEWGKGHSLPEVVNDMHHVVNDMHHVVHQVPQVVNGMHQGGAPDAPKQDLVNKTNKTREEEEPPPPSASGSSSLTLENLNGKLDAVYEICGIKNPTDKQARDAKEAAAYIVQQNDTIEDIHQFKADYWWGNTPPHPSQVRSEWDRFKATLADRQQVKRASVSRSVGGVKLNVDQLKEAMKATEANFEERRALLLEQGRQLAARMQ